MFKGYIYKCTCVISGKSYVGLTTKTIEERKKEHLHSSYNLEVKYVAFYDSFHNGYNLTFRGEPKVVNMYSEDGILLDTGTVGHLASKYNLDDSAICNRRYKSTGKYKYSGKIDSVKIVWKYI